jgi:tetratricopeptide (TPR) repeat protein
MIEFLHFISGEVPGGILLLIFLLIVINLALYYLYKSSKLFSGDIYKRKTIRANIILFGIYIVLWIFLQPPTLPDRVIILPFEKDETVDYTICEVLQQQLSRNISDDFILHRWEWLYQTANIDSVIIEEYRITLAKKIGIAIIITGKIKELGNEVKIDLEIISSSGIRNVNINANSYPRASEKIFGFIRKDLNLLKEQPLKTFSTAYEIFSAISRLKILLLNDQYDVVIKSFNEPDSHIVAFVADAYLKKGISELEENTTPGLHNDKMNPNFRRLLNLIIPYSKEGNDTPEMNIILAQMYMHQKNYGMAEICLQKALTQDKYNPRIYFFLSFLHESRYQERGFKTRTSVLDHAVKLDPGYGKAVYELADQLYKTGTGAVTDPNTMRSIEVLRHFLQLNPNNVEILALLGKILLQSKYTLDAVDIYTKLIDLVPSSAAHQYNLGICYYHKKDYQKAKELFERAIELDDYSDAYIYLGAMSRLEGDLEKALYYYRERVKRKSGDDDQYARQAMKGIRLVLNDLAEQEEKATKNENKNPDN